MNQQCRNRQLCAQNKERRQTSKNTIRHTKENGRIHVFTTCKQFLSLMIHTQCYSQSRPVKVLQYHFFSIYGRKPLLPIYPLSLLNRYLRGKEHLCYSIFSFMCNVVQIVDCFQWGLCYSIFSFMCNVVQTVDCFQWGLCYSIFSFMCMLCRSLFVLLSFFFWPLRCLFLFDLSDFDYPFGIFKLFFMNIYLHQYTNLLSRQMHPSDKSI